MRGPRMDETAYLLPTTYIRSEDRSREGVVPGRHMEERERERAEMNDNEYHYKHVFNRHIQVFVRYQLHYTCSCHSGRRILSLYHRWSVYI